MGLERGRETQLFDRQCVLYTIREEAWELALIYKLQGDKTITEKDVASRGEALIELWGVFEADKKFCYICGKTQSQHGLCSCYSEVYIDPVTVREVVTRYPDNKIIRHYVCAECHVGVPLHAYIVKRAYNNRGSFRMPGFCSPCYKSRSREQRQSNAPRASLGDKVSSADREEMERQVAEAAPQANS